MAGLDARQFEAAVEHPAVGRVLAWNDASCDPVTGVVTYGTFYKLADDRLYSSQSRIAFPSQERPRVVDRRRRPHGRTMARRLVGLAILFGLARDHPCRESLLFRTASVPLAHEHERAGRSRSGRTMMTLLEQDALHGAAEIAVAVGQPRGARPIESGPAQVSASSRIQSPTGSRARLSVRSPLMKVHSRKSSTDEVPLQKSAAIAARISGEVGAPSTIGRSARYHTAAGPGRRNEPRADPHREAAQERRVAMPPVIGSDEVSGGAHVVRRRGGRARQRALLAADAQHRGAHDLRAVRQQAHRDELDLLAFAQHLDRRA